MGENLYKRIEKECEVHISAKLSALVGQSPDLVKFLTLTLNVCSVWDLGLQLFRKHLKLAPEVEQRIVTGILSLIESERLGAVVDTTLLSHLLKMFTALRMYTESFEKPFLENTSEFYSIESIKYMQQSDIPDYLRHVEKRLYNEDKRCKLYLEANTRKPLFAIAEKQLLEQHSSAILEKGFVMLIEAKQVNDLQRMYTLFKRVNALELLRKALSSYIRGTGEGTVMDGEKDKESVPFLLEFKSSLDMILEQSFFKDEAFSSITKDSFEHLINLRQLYQTKFLVTVTIELAPENSLLCRNMGIDTMA
ncbi:Cullin family protein [Rhynchospora pubera]|uniref:Cullin family protein n=1 Tax=Rhynchospora pubera TaxID=906938 RepID=A0AAV8F8L9_9POAL|nr:Cullin family protein [Rhynchospora pubera]